MSFYIYQRVNR